MPGSPKKLPAVRQGHTTRDVALREEQPPIPMAPRRLTKRTRQRWADYWKSSVARAADPVTDLHLVERYFRAIDEYEKVLPVFEKTRLVKGSTGQIALNPLAGYLAQREAVMKACETELGLTPMARMRLGIATGEAQLTALELNRRLNQAPKVEIEAPSEDDVWQGEWSEA